MGYLSPCVITDGEVPISHKINKLRFNNGLSE